MCYPVMPCHVAPCPYSIAADLVIVFRHCFVPQGPKKLKKGSLLHPFATCMAYLNRVMARRERLASTSADCDALHQS
eukprot:6183673-Pleurochrysis_carterae.AAC.4